MNDSRTGVQDTFLNQLRKNGASATVFLMNGVKLQGVVTGFDSFALLLRRDGHVQMIYKHAISTIMPNAPLPPESQGESGAA